MQWIADRFFLSGGIWCDAATGAPVQMLVEPSGHDDLGWDEECARLSNLRHPALNALLDYGRTSGGRRFEAYACNPPRSRRDARPPVGGRLDARLSGLLTALGITVSEARRQRLFRAASPGTCPPDAVAVTLQPRRVIQTLEEALDRMEPPGTVTINVSGAPGMGLRTSRLVSVRLARLRGFVPLGAEVIARHPAIAATLYDRHVCILDTGDASGGSAAVATFIAGIGRASPRRHVLIRFSRPTQGLRTSLPLDAMAPETLVRMVVSAGAAVPGEEALLAAARTSRGNPGAFLAALQSGYPSPSGAMVVHEAPQRYVMADAAGSPEPPLIGGRLLGAALRAVPRASGLARRGRHALAARVLLRALRVLEGRQRHEDAARCALALGALALDRGAVRAAEEHYARAGRLAGQGVLAIEASVGCGIALVDANRLVEAEAVLRGTMAAAEMLGQAALGLAAVAALVRCLYWQGRSDDGLAAAADWRDVAGRPVDCARLLAAVARCEARLGRATAAVASARQAQMAATRSRDPHATASAELALAEVLHAAGDAPGASAALARAVRVARSAHLPVARLRAAIVRASLDATDLSRVLRLKHLPPLLERRVSDLRRRTPAANPHVEPVTELERLLDVTQRASDERSALEQICKAVAARLGAGTVAVVASDDRVLALEGRSWRSSQGVGQAILCGTRVLPDACREPREAAEPVRYGGEVVAALACRWTPGAAVDRDGAVLVLRAAALSAAGPVRALLDAAMPPPPAGWADLIGESPSAIALRDAVSRAARAPFPVLVEGESGSGKELVARAIHRFSPRRDRKFCALNCAALTDDLVEAELFGHTRGAFTGAMTDRAGLFEEGDGGTVFLDEVGELSARAQAKLLRVLQEGEVRRVGENMPRRVDVRVVAATNRRLEDEAAAGRFRVDLRFRLDVIRITVPPLRERSTDVPLLAAHFWREASTRVGSSATLSGEALAALARYDWPGNVRELQNVIAWIAVHSPRRGRVGPSALPRHVAQSGVPQTCTFEAAREEFERRFIRAALAGANGKRGRAADAMGITRQGLAKMMRRLNMDP